MTRTTRVFVTVAVCSALLRAAPDMPQSTFDAANLAWESGDFAGALKGYLTLMKSPDAERFLEPIALQTGELFVTDDITTDGRVPRFSPDGRLISFETGPPVMPTTRIVRADGDHATVADLNGAGAVLAASGRKVAYLKLAAVTSTWEQMRDSTIVVRDLDSGQDHEIKTPGLLKASLAWHPDGRTLYFLGGSEADESRNDIYTVSEAGEIKAATTDAGFKSAPTIDPTGKTMLYAVAPANIFRRPPAGGRGGRGGGGGGGGRGGDGAQRPPSFALVTLTTGRTTTLVGSAPVFSPDGTTIAFVNRSGSEYSLNVASVGDATTPKSVLRGSNRIDAPAFSPDGRRLAFQALARDDWEISVVGVDGTGERRLTREIQHDVQPRFISATRLLGLIGEPRHRRSYLYDVDTQKRTRLFHNNTVRTIAPEYAWDVSGEGMKILVGADRDGDTISAERGVYLVHLDRRVTAADVVKRLVQNLALETMMRDEGARMFKPIADAVRATVADVSTAKIYEHEKALTDFDSKHISRPGNKLAIDYLFNAYKSFGYEPALQPFEVQQALGGTTANVVATLGGTDNPELVYVVSSHFDSVAAGPGADDDTSGTAALLEAARVLAKRPMPATIVFASFTGEEAGLLGSREFVRRAAAAKMQMAGALNNDTVGWMNDHRLDNTIRYSNAGIRDVQHGAAMLFTRLTTYDAHYYRSTDAAAFYEAWGDIIGGIGSYPVLGSPHYHQASDILETIDPQLIAETSKTTVASVMLLASSPSRLKDLKVASYAGQVANLTWTPSPEKGVQAYVVAWGPASDPLRQRVRVTEPRASLKGVAQGTRIAVKAVNARGLESWDWARVAVP